MLQHKGAISIALARGGTNITRRRLFPLSLRIHAKTLSMTVTHPAPEPRNLVKGRWEPIIGLEIHAQIKSTTKLFSEARTMFNAPTNTNVTLIDAAYPGTLPVSKQRLVVKLL